MPYQHASKQPLPDKSPKKRFGRYTSYTQENPPPHIPDDDICLGDHSIGKAVISCAYLSEHTRWGLRKNRQAGLFRFQIKLHEPAGFLLAAASIYLTFLAEDRDRASPVTPIIKDSYPVRLCGTTRSKQVTRSKTFGPTATAAGFASLELGSRQAGAEWTKLYHWQLTSSILPDEVYHRKYTRVVYAWEASRVSEQSERDKIDTHIVFWHHGQPFKIAVNMEGRLAKGFRKYRFWSKKSKERIEAFHPKNGTIDFGAEMRALEHEVRKANATYEMEEAQSVDLAVSDPEPEQPQSILETVLESGTDLAAAMMA